MKFAILDDLYMKAKEQKPSKLILNTACGLLQPCQENSPTGTEVDLDIT